MRIGEYMDSFDFADELTAVNEMLLDAQSKVSFWGQRIITLNGYEGSVSLDAIAKKVLNAGYRRDQNDDLTIEERIAGIEMTHQLRNFYEMTDSDLANSCLITKILYFCRNFFEIFETYTIRFQTDIGVMEEQFLSFSRNHFEKEFGDQTRDSEGRKLSGGTRGDKILATEEAIRSKLTM